MRFLFRVLVLAALMVPGVAAAQVDCSTDVRGGITSPIAIVSVEGICVDLSGEIRPAPDGKMFVLNHSIPSEELGGLASILVNATFNPDPFITFGFTSTNADDGPLTYTVLFGTPIEPGFYTDAASSGGVSVSNAGSGTATVDNSAVDDEYISAFGTTATGFTTLGVDIGTEPCIATGSPDSTTCEFGPATNTFAPTLFDNIEVLLTYTQTQASSVASWSGNVTLGPSQQQVPEPATVTLLAVSSLAFGVVGLVRRRRHQG